MKTSLSRRGLLGLTLAAWLGLLDRRGAKQSAPQPASRGGAPPAAPPGPWRLANVRDDGAGTTTWTYGCWPGAAPGSQPLGTMTYRTPLCVTSVYERPGWPLPTNEPGPAQTDPDPGEEPEAGGPHPGGGGEPGRDH